MTYPQSRAGRVSAVSLAVAGMLLATSLQAGVIDNTNNTPGKLGACGVEGEPTACVGAWNLDNVDVALIRALDGTVFGEFLKDSGVYSLMTTGDSFASYIKDAAGTVMAKLTGKVWPVGEPTGIKAVKDDTAVKEGKPQNCLINTSYLGQDPAVDGDVDQYLDDNPANPVICSSFFQSHKRFKIAMQPTTVEGVANGAEGKPIDLVFNVKDEAAAALRPYQVFSKINNYTGKQLKGYKVQVGRTVGGTFKTATELGITDRLQISLGIQEGPAGANIFDGDGLATFSHGLFGPIDKHFPAVGFFDERIAGFDVVQNCTAPCESDTITSTANLPSNYTTLFGDWLPNQWAPKGIFYDFDNDPATDADLVAWWNGTAWVKNYASGFAPVSDAEFSAWKANPLYSVDVIEDVLNLGLNYIVKVGNNIGDTEVPTDSTFTIRITPVVADTQVAPSYVDTTPTPLVDPVVTPVDPVVPTTPVATDDGGGCAAATGPRPMDPVLPLLAALGLMGYGLRRLRRR